MNHSLSENVSPHQFRTALNSILGFSKLLLSEETANLSSEQRKQIDYIYKAGYALMEHIQEEKPQLIMLWSAEKDLVSSISPLFKEKIEKMAIHHQKKVILIHHSMLNVVSFQSLKEAYHIILIMLPPLISHVELSSLKTSDEIVILSSSYIKENEHQILFLKEASYLASRTHFYTLETDLSGEKLSCTVRKLTHRTVGIALSSGMAQGIAHIGVLKVLKKANVPIDLIAGTSGGALYGALFAAGMDIHEIESIIIHAFKRNILCFSLDILLSRKGFLGTQTIIRKILQEPLNTEDILFNQLKTPLMVVVTDLVKGKEHLCYSGSVIDAVRASISIPALVAPVKKRERVWVDGVVTMPVPVLPLLDRGVDITIAVHASEISRYTKKNPHLIDIFMRARSITSDSLSRHPLDCADIVIKPDMHHMGYLDYHKARELISLGEAAAHDALPCIQKKLCLSS